VWDRRQLNPTNTRRISSYQYLDLWTWVDNNDILLIVGLNYNIKLYLIKNSPVVKKRTAPEKAIVKDSGQEMVG